MIVHSWLTNYLSFLFKTYVHIIRRLNLICYCLFTLLICDRRNCQISRREPKKKKKFQTKNSYSGELKFSDATKRTDGNGNAASHLYNYSCTEFFQKKKKKQTTHTLSHPSLKILFSTWTKPWNIASVAGNVECLKLSWKFADFPRSWGGLSHSTHTKRTPNPTPPRWNMNGMICDEWALTLLPFISQNTSQHPPYSIKDKYNIQRSTIINCFNNNTATTFAYITFHHRQHNSMKTLFHKFIKKNIAALKLIFLITEF